MKRSLTFYPIICLLLRKHLVTLPLKLCSEQKPKTPILAAKGGGWRDSIWIPFPWRLRQAWGGRHVRGTRLCKVTIRE